MFLETRLLNKLGHREYSGHMTRTVSIFSDVSITWPFALIHLSGWMRRLLRLIRADIFSPHFLLDLRVQGSPGVRAA